MANFKGIFTFIAFAWLWGCGFFAFGQWLSRDNFAWLALVLSSWALPLWMLLRYRWPRLFIGDERESPALAVVLAGLAIALLTDIERGAPLYLSLLNLGLVLVYLFHASSVRHPLMPGVEAAFPHLNSRDGSGCEIRRCMHQYGAGGALVVVLRGSFCASSRRLALELRELEPVLEKFHLLGIVVSTEPAEHWLTGATRAGERIAFVTIAAEEGPSPFFVETGGVPLWVRLLGIRRAGRRRRTGLGACRPSAWLLDGESYIRWRHLPGNYRQPGSAALLRSQLSRLAPDD